jgi:hypothetical protein
MALDPDFVTFFTKSVKKNPRRDVEAVFGKSDDG